MVAACGTAVSFALACTCVNRFWLSKNAAEEKPAATVAAPAPFGPPAAPGISEKFVAIPVQRLERESSQSRPAGHSER
jgi:hypothetical protein